MKRFLPLFLLLLLLPCPGVHSAEQLPLVTAEWPPYASSSLPDKGYVVEFVREVVQEMGMEPVITFYPWSRAQKAIETGDFFGGFPFGITKQRQQRFNYSDLFLKTNTKFFYDKDKMKNLSPNLGVDSLTNYTVGVIRKSKTLRQLKAAGFQKIYQADSVEQVIRMLQMGRVQLAALVEHSGWHALQNLFPGETENWGAIQFYKMEAALLISKTYPESDRLRQKFNHALKVVQERQTFPRLLQKYNLPAQ